MTYVHGCALLSTGGVRCWGEFNNLGRLGYNAAEAPDGTCVWPPNGCTPADAGDVRIGGAASDIASGSSNVCVSMGSRVLCWGASNNNRLGYTSDEDIGDDEFPEEGDSLDLGAHVEQLDSGWGHTCALLTGGAVKCWGDNENGQLGRGSATTSEPLDASATVNVGFEVAQVSSGGNRTCVISTTGSLKCWGPGPLGYGNAETVGDDEPPSDVGTIDVGGIVESVSVGATHICAVRADGKLFCWGNNTHAQLGLGSTDDPAATLTPVEIGSVSIPEDVEAVAAAFDGTCALVSGGDVRCWGSAADGRLGFVHTDGYVGDNELPSEVGLVSLGAKAESLSAGFGARCVVTTAGTMRCWGRQGLNAQDRQNSIEIPSSAGDVSLF